MQTQTAQNTTQGDVVTPLETGTRQRTDAEKQRAAEAKAARTAALAEQDRERQQRLLRDAQELTRCLNSGMGLLTPVQVRQIANAVTGTNNEPMEVLRSLNERSFQARAEKWRNSPTQMVKLSFTVFRFSLQILLECGDFDDRLIFSDNLMFLDQTF